MSLKTANREVAIEVHNRLQSKPFDHWMHLRFWGKPVTFGNLCGVPWRKSMFRTCQHVPTMNDMFPPIRAYFYLTFLRQLRVPSYQQNRLTSSGASVAQRDNPNMPGKWDHNLQSETMMWKRFSLCPAGAKLITDSSCSPQRIPGCGK